VAVLTFTAAALSFVLTKVAMATTGQRAGLGDRFPSERIRRTREAGPNKDADRDQEPRQAGQASGNDA
jgi:hypothetical protein